MQCCSSFSSEDTFAGYIPSLHGFGAMGAAAGLPSRKAGFRMLLAAAIALLAARHTAAQGVQELRSTCELPSPLTNDLVSFLRYRCSVLLRPYRFRLFVDGSVHALHIVSEHGAPSKTLCMMS